MITATIKGRTYTTDKTNRGVFVGETTQWQLVGYCDTPLFRTAAQFRGWVLRNLEVEDRRWCIVDRLEGFKVVSFHQTYAAAARAARGVVRFAIRRASDV